jgi:hypothetical protein
MTPRSLALVSLAALSCVRAPSPPVRPTPARESAPTRESASVAAADVRVPEAAQPIATPTLAALPPLFARKVGCIDGNNARAFARYTRADGGSTRHELTADELRARPWLWGQYPSGCAGVGWPLPRADGGPSEALRAVTEGAVSARVLAVADRYLSWGRVDDYQRWAPFDCRLPPSSRPQPDLGASAPHGRKVYYLYALDRAAYVEHRDVAQQIIVKEAWAPHEVPSSEAISNGYPAQCAEERDGVCVQPGAFTGLFVMLRGAVTAETDQGWTYATVDPRGEITASGRIAPCMRCHERAPHGRLFGLPATASQWR